MYLVVIWTSNLFLLSKIDR